MKKHLTMLLACLFLSIGVALAQTQINGTVVSESDGEPIVGATVRVVGHTLVPRPTSTESLKLRCP